MKKIFKNIPADHLTYHQTTITHKIIDKSYAAIHEIKPVLTLDYVGFTVPELSKWLIYDFYCKYIKKTLTLNCCLLTQIVLLMKSNQKIFMKNFLNANICLPLVIFQKTKSFMIIKRKWSLAEKLYVKEFQSINFLD